MDTMQSNYRFCYSFRTFIQLILAYYLKKQNDNLIIFCTLDVKLYLNNFKLSMDMYRLFISHSWTYSDAYDCLIKLLEGQNFRFYDHSVPKNDPIHTKGSEKELRAAIDAQIKGTSCVLILAGVYATYSKWINIEIDIAKKYNKPIIAIEPWGAERTSAIVKNNAIKIVKWQGKSIVNAIIDVVE